jgi:apolipoprotein N-acyltransferase
VFPDLVRQFYKDKDGGDFIVTITNDAWFGATTGPYQHFSMAALRAVENRKFLVRAANTGISGFIDPAGRVFAKSALMERTVITRNIFKGKVTSFYTAYGNIFVYLCGLLCALILIKSLRR